MQSFKPQGLVNTVWAFAISCKDHPVLFKKIGDELAVRDNLGEVNAGDLSIIVWAFSTANEIHSSMFSIIGDEIVASEELRTFDTKLVCNVVWAFATTRAAMLNLY